MSQPIIQNLLQKQKEYNQYSYTELRCRRCELLIGCILIDNSKETSSAYFIKKNIVSKENKQMVFSLLGLRSDLLLKMQNHLCSLFDKSTAIIDISKQVRIIIHMRYLIAYRLRTHWRNTHIQKKELMSCL